MAAQKYTVRPQLLVSLMVLFVIIFSALYFVLDEEAKIKQEQLELLQAEKEGYREQLQKLKNDIQYVKSPQGIEQYARARGMIMPGEEQFAAGEGGDLQ